MKTLLSVLIVVLLCSNVSAKKKMIPFAKQLIITDMERDIKLLDNKIKDYKQRAINPMSFGSLRSKDNRKGWVYRGGGDFKQNAQPMSKLPKNYKRKHIKIVYYTKKERKVYLKAKYLAIAAKCKVEMDALVVELKQIIGKPKSKVKK